MNLEDPFVTFKPVLHSLIKELFHLTVLYKRYKQTCNERCYCSESEPEVVTEPNQP